MQLVLPRRRDNRLDGPEWLHFEEYREVILLSLILPIGYRSVPPCSKFLSELLTTLETTPLESDK